MTLATVRKGHDYRHRWESGPSGMAKLAHVVLVDERLQDVCFTWHHDYSACKKLHHLSLNDFRRQFEGRD